MSEALRLYNTLSRQLEAFEAIEPPEVRLYTCGPTVYDYSHIGNLRTFLFEDVLRRTLGLFGFEVTQVMNLTDIDDKTILRAKEQGVTLREVTDHYVEAFFADLDAVRVQRAEHYPRATDYIQPMVDIVKRLQEQGRTYESGGSIYYRISTFDGYGKLSGVRPEDNLAGARVDSDEYEKEDARDFVLWKGTRPGEPSWDTEIGRGRPGWHLECSAMSMALLGESFDIHTGGVDNIFPHHENEIAQSEGATGKPFARYWLHAEHLMVEGEKMAKSKGNFFTLRDLVEKGFDPVVLRYLMISVPYRQKLNFTFDGLHGAAQCVDRIANTQRRLAHTPDAEGGGGLGQESIATFRSEFRAALGDDLNTAKALAALHGLLRQVNSALDGGGLSAPVRHLLGEAFAEADSVLGVFPKQDTPADDIEDEIRELLEAREIARKEKNWSGADAIRDQLLARGIVIEDTPHGPVWRRE